MSIESLLTSLETDVAAVADVTANSGGAFGCNGSETADVADVAAPRTNALPATSATAAKRQTLQEKCLQNKPVTSATSATAEKTEVRGAHEEIPLSAAEVRTLSAWLDGIGEDDSEIRAHMLEQCRRDTEARRYFLAKAAPVVRLRLTLEAEDGARSEALLEVPRARYDGERVLEAFERHRMAGTTRVVAVRQVELDDRRFCRDCARLRGGVCTAASQIGALPGYRPVDDVPRRCPAFREREQ